MRKIVLRTILAVFLGLMFTSSVFAAETHQKTFVDFLNENTLLKNANISVTGSTSFYSQYMWRGMRLDNDYVLQPSLTVNAFNGWSLNVWGSYDVDNSADALNSNETDTTLTYTKKFEGLSLLGYDFKPISVTVGHVYYDFPGTNTFAKEAVLGFAYDTFLSPTFTWYHDYSRESQGGGDGDYLMLCASKSLEINKNYGVTLDLSGHVGYNKGDFILGEGGDVLLTSGITVPITQNLKFSPTINYAIPFGNYTEEKNGEKESEFYWGSTLNYTF